MKNFDRGFEKNILPLTETKLSSAESAVEFIKSSNLTPESALEEIENDKAGSSLSTMLEKIRKIPPHIRKTIMAAMLGSLLTIGYKEASAEPMPAGIEVKTGQKISSFDKASDTWVKKYKNSIRETAANYALKGDIKTQVKLGESMLGSVANVILIGDKEAMVTTGVGLGGGDNSAVCRAVCSDETKMVKGKVETRFEISAGEIKEIGIAGLDDETNAELEKNFNDNLIIQEALKTIAKRKGLDENLSIQINITDTRFGLLISNIIVEDSQGKTLKFQTKCSDDSKFISSMQTATYKILNTEK